MKKIVVPILLSFFLFSCKKENSSIKTETQTNKQIATKTAYDVPVFLDSLKTSGEILEFLNKRNKAVSGILDNLPENETVKLFKDYRKENDSALTLLIFKNQPFLDNYDSFYNFDESTQKSTLIIPDSLKGQVKKYNDAGVEVWSIGEGMHEFRMFPDFYKKFFAKKSAPDLKEFLENQSVEDKDLFSNDAAIVVAWSEIARRIIFRENFLRKYPATALKNEIQSELNFYRRSFILGMDNTPTMNYSGEGFSPEYVKHFRYFIQKNPQSETSDFLKFVLSKKWTGEELFKEVDKKYAYSYPN